MSSLAAVRRTFVRSLDFELDEFQTRALDAIDQGRSVLVAAPTGSGKTVVAEYAVARALAQGRKAFYTTPLKALSNQKYGDLVRRHGLERVGLLTGDNAINGEAPVVVMTTEVLRNMIYAASSALEGLGYVVLDEVHYLENAWRGPVWEEVIIHTPPDVDLVCLSATVSNAEEFADWIETVRGSTVAVIEERRPVELQHLYLLGDRDSDTLLLLPTFVHGRPNPEAAELDHRWSHRPAPGRRSRPRYYTPRRADVVEVLAGEDMLPAIYFIFSRAACDDAARFCVNAGLRLTTADERTQIRAIIEARVETLTDADLAVLGFEAWRTGLEAGIGAHHAGMVPPFKEAVEACFAAGLVKVVFATETLALGINMPARTVVIEKLTKFTGERHEFLRPGDYTQLTGRAGRRGIDEVGYGVVLWSPFVPFDQVAGLASKRTYPLTSAFHPTYNMAANLVRRYPADEAHHLLNLSFAQYRADVDVVRLERELAETTEQISATRARATCDRGDLAEYRALLRADREGRRAVRAGPASRRDVEAALERIKPGDVVVVPGGADRVAVVSTTRRRGDLRLAAVTAHGRRMWLTGRDFRTPPHPVASLPLPTPFQPRSRAFLVATAALLRRRQPPSDGPSSPNAGEGTSGAGRVGSEATGHPCRACPDVRAHLRAAERLERLEAEAGRLERTIRGRTESLARQFDRVLRVLDAWGYVDGWSLTADGERLARLYHECDLVVAESLATGLLDGLDAASVAGLVSAFTYEARGPEGTTPPAWFPTPVLRERWQAIDGLATALNRAEQDAGLPPTRRPDAGFVALAHAWAAGEDLAEVLGDDEVSGGDFVRNVKQLVDLLRQVGDLAPERSTAAAARAAADRVFRGVVSASSVVVVGDAQGVAG